MGKHFGLGEKYYYGKAPDEALLMQEGKPIQGKHTAVIGWWDEYETVTDEDGNESQVLVEPPPRTLIDEDDNEYPNPAFIERGVWVDSKTPEEYLKEEQDKLLAHYHDLTVKHIKAQVDAYNDKHQMTFGSIESCSNYRFEDPVEYSHQPFAMDVWKWSVLTWKTIRNEIIPSIDPTKIPTEEEYLAMLPTYNGTMEPYSP